MRTPEEILAKHGYPMHGDDLDPNLIHAMEEFAQECEYNYSNFWEDAHAKLEEKLRIQYDAELEAFKTSFENRIRDEYEQKLNEAAHADASEITSLRKLQSVLKTRLEKAERDINDLRNYDLEQQTIALKEESEGWHKNWLAATAAVDELQNQITSYEIDRINLVAMTLERDEFDEANKNLVAQCKYMTAEMRGWKERWESAILEGDLLRTKNEELQERIIECEGDYQDICDLAGQLALPNSTSIF